MEQLEQIIKKLESDSKPGQLELKGLLEDVMGSLRLSQASNQAEISSSSSIETAVKEEDDSSSSSFSSTPSSKMVTISDDILELIFDRLSPEQRAIASRCCRKWRALVMSRWTWWGTGQLPILVKRILNVDQAGRIIDFIRTLPSFHFRFFVMKPNDSNQQVSLVKIFCLRRGHIIHRHLFSAIIRDASTTPTPASVLGNNEVFLNLSVRFNLFWPTMTLSAQTMLRGREGLNWMGRLGGWRLGGRASPFALFQWIRSERSTSHILNFNFVALVQTANDGIPLLPTKEALTVLHTLVLPLGMPSSLFSNFLLPNLTNLYGDPNSLMKMRFVLDKVQILGVKLRTDQESWDGEILKLLGILTMTSGLKCLVLREGPSIKSKSQLDISCLLNLLLQTKFDSGSFAFSWCPRLIKIQGFESLQCSQLIFNLLYQLKKDRLLLLHISGCTLI